jgi:hypothetical protein
MGAQQGDILGKCSNGIAATVCRKVAASISPSSAGGSSLRAPRPIWAMVKAAFDFRDIEVRGSRSISPVRDGLCAGIWQAQPPEIGAIS